MGINNCALIKEKDQSIEENRLKIKNKKNIKRKLVNKLDTIGNVYEYLIIPFCAISITFVALFSGVIIYILPALSSVIGICVVVYKFVIVEKREKINNLFPITLL